MSLKKPHFHRIKPAYDQKPSFKVLTSMRPKRPLYGAAAIEFQKEQQKPLYFYFNDLGQLHIGTESSTPILVKGTYDIEPNISWLDLETAFNLGRVVAHLEHQPLSECEPIALHLITERMQISTCKPD